MTRRRLSDFLDALAEGRRPGRFRAEPEDVDVLRTAITLRSARPGDGVPDQQFVSELFGSLSAPEGSGVVPITRATTRRRGRVAVAAVAAGLVLVGGTAAVTESLQPAASPAAVPAPQGTALRTGTFETADGRVMGQIVAYRGNPSWVFMNVDGSSYTGPIVCQLQVANGTTVAVGNFQLQGGTGQFSRNIQVDIGRLRGAKLVNASGTIVASATFA